MKVRALSILASVALAGDAPVHEDGHADQTAPATTEANTNANANANADANANANAGADEPAPENQAATFAVPNPVALPNKCLNAGDIALTVDEGPGQMTGEILQMLGEQGIDVQATFHIVTQHLGDTMVETFAKAAMERGHVIGLRYRPPTNFSSMTNEDIIASLIEQSTAVANVLGRHPRFVRMEYNSVDERVLEIAREMGFVITTYNLDAGDYAASTTPEQVRERYVQALGALGEFKGRFISLHHDSQPYAFLAPSIRDSIIAARNMGYNFVDLGACLGETYVYKSDAAGLEPMLTNAGVAAGAGTGSGNADGGYYEVEEEDSGEGFVPEAALPDRVNAAAGVMKTGVAMVMAALALVM